LACQAGNVAPRPAGADTPEAMPRIVGAVQAAAQVLATLERQNGAPRTLSQIAREAGLYKGTCNDLLYTLELLGYVVRQPETRGYVLGPALASLGAQAVTDTGFLPVALRHLRLLGERVGATC